MGASDVTRVLELVNGYRASCVIGAAVELGVLECLARGEPLASLGLHPGGLARLVAGLRALGLVEAAGTLSTAGRLLVKELRPWALLTAREYVTAWGDLAHAVRTGEPAFDHAFGQSAWQHRRAHPELDEAFQQVVSAAQARAAAALLDAYDFARARCIVDVGGGHGGVLAAILKRHPQATGVLFDQPHVVAEAPPIDRCRAVGGSFFTAVDGAVPAGDVLILKHCLHNWDDPHCLKILAACRAAMADDATLLVVEELHDGSIPAVMMDLHMLAVLGGRERTRDEYQALLAAAGLAVTRVIPTRPGAPDVIEAKRGQLLA